MSYIFLIKKKSEILKFIRGKMRASHDQLFINGKPAFVSHHFGGYTNNTPNSRERNPQKQTRFDKQLRERERERGTERASERLNIKPYEHTPTLSLYTVQGSQFTHCRRNKKYTPKSHGWGKIFVVQNEKKAQIARSEAEHPIDH